MKIHASPDSMVSLFHAASVLQKMVDGDDICVDSCGERVLDRSLDEGCAASHSRRSAMARERISGGDVCLFSKVWRLQLIHSPQQIQGKRLAEDPTGGRFTLAKKC